MMLASEPAYNVTYNETGCLMLVLISCFQVLQMIVCNLSCCYMSSPCLPFSLTSGGEERSAPFSLAGPEIKGHELSFCLYSIYLLGILFTIYLTYTLSFNWMRQTFDWYCMSYDIVGVMLINLCYWLIHVYTVQLCPSPPHPSPHP